MIEVSSLYVHLPFCKHLCNYCDFYKYTYDQQKIEDFNQLLLSQFDAQQTLLSHNNYKLVPLETLYFGGGTPSLWGIEGAEFFKQHLLPKIELKADCEFTMEVDPGTWSPESIQKWQECGVNRFSIGTQAMDENFIKIMDRSHTLNDTLQTLKYFASLKTNFSVDFMLGLPHSEKRDILTELKMLLDYNPNHVSLYILATRKNYPLNHALPEDDLTREEYLKVSDFLQSQGFVHYEVSNFAKPSFESKHNLKYWHYEPVAAIGPSATGLLPLQTNAAIRYKWKVTTNDYQLEELDQYAIKLEKLYLGLRTNEGIHPPAFFANNTKATAILQKWCDQDLAYFQNDKFILNAKGMVMMDSLVQELI